MAGTPTGGKRAALTNTTQYGEDFYKRIGSKGGSNGRGPDYAGGFANPTTGRELARIAGSLGGRMGRKTPKELTDAQRVSLKAQAARRASLEARRAHNNEVREQLSALARKWGAKPLRTKGYGTV